MKSQACLPKILLLTTALVIAGSLPVQASATPPLAPAGAKNLAAPKPAEPEPKIPGFVIPRPNGGYLSLLVDEGGHFKLTFYDAKKKLTPVDVPHARLRWPAQYKVIDERTVLNPNADGTALTSPKFVRIPYAYRIYLYLFAGEGDEAGEHYVIDFRQ